MGALVTHDRFARLKARGHADSPIGARPSAKIRVNSRYIDEKVYFYQGHHVVQCSFVRRDAATCTPRCICLPPPSPSQPLPMVSSRGSRAFAMQHACTDTGANTGRWKIPRARSDERNERRRCSRAGGAGRQGEKSRL